MSTFTYEARHKNGALIKGKIQAVDANQAADQLVKNNLIPLKIRMVSSESFWNFLSISVFSPKVSSEALTIFCRQMYSLTKAGIPVASAINRLSEITINITLANTLKNVFKEISLGTSLSKSMQHYSTVFPPLMVALVASAEATGRLDDAFLQASKHYELESTSRKRIKTALRYPILVIFFAFAAVMLINMFVIPKFADFYASFHAALPLPTRILIGFSLFVRNYWWIVILSIAALIGLAYYFLHYAPFRIFIDRAKMKLPVFGSIVERIVMADFSRNLAMLLQTGVSLKESLILVSDVVNNSYAKEKILAMIESIEHGKNLSQAASAVHFLSPLILQMLSVGEETGNMDKMLLEAGDFYEREIDYDIKQLADKIEPILLIVVGLMVLVLALGVFLPMWNLVYVVH